MLIGMIWRPTPDRLEAFNTTVAFWSRFGDVRFFDSGHEPFNRAASRNMAVRWAADNRYTKLVVTDADCFPQEGPLLEAWAATDDTSVRLPYTACIVHSKDGNPLGTYGFTCGGTYITTPTAWFRFGGQDERFTKWAPEDFAFMMAHNTLVGPMGRHEGLLFSLGHDGDPNRHTDNDELVALYRRYEAANGDPELMRSCIPS